MIPKPEKCGVHQGTDNCKDRNIFEQQSQLAISAHHSPVNGWFLLKSNNIFNIKYNGFEVLKYPEIFSPL